MGSALSFVHTSRSPVGLREANPTGGGEGGVEPITRNRLSQLWSTVYRGIEGIWELLKVTVFREIIDRGTLTADRSQRKFQILNSKSQTNSNFQIPNFKSDLGIGTFPRPLSSDF